jgi:aerobic C4-dicarboxylate transport protein
MVVFATTSSETVLPRTTAKLEDAGCEESVVGQVILTGYSFNLDGTCLYLATVAVFLAQATNTPLTVEQQLGLLAVLLLASKGAAGVAGAAFVVLAATLASVGTIPAVACSLDSRRARIDVGRPHAYQSDRKRSSHDCHRQMGKGA